MNGKLNEDLSSVGDNPNPSLGMVQTDVDDNMDLGDFDDSDCDMGGDCSDADLDALLAGTDGDLSGILDGLGVEDEGLDNIDVLLGIADREAITESVENNDKSYLFRNTLGG